MASTEDIICARQKLLIKAISKFASLDSNNVSAEAAENEVKSLYNFDDKAKKWVAFVERFPTDPASCFEALKELNMELTTISVLKGDGVKPSDADVVVFAAVHSSVIGLPNSEREKLPHVMRWVDYIQNKVDLGDIFEKILVEKAKFEPQLLGAKAADKVEVESDAKKTVQSTKPADKPEAEVKTKKSDTVKKPATNKEATQEKKKATEAENVEKDKEASVSLLNIQVGLICKAWKHPSAESLLVEEIDVGEAKLRQVVSGLAKYSSPEQLTNRHVVLITNVKPGKLRDVLSEGLVLCASNEDHTVVEPLLPPAGAKPGERVSFSGIDGKPEDVLNPKKKQLEKITPHLFTDEKGVATFKGIPFMTSAGPCTSSIPKATIK
ncbi:putative methionine--tRNA ligase [Morus notabilis]|uniref:Putative methionine--tRNA ligase n=1 Tax=Morus notabilis TaxID=981085 RepID=W9RLU8_9ROSA|nr:aminoacyl tRNA synthase complex-interacting multifunctional protein 1 [Morus notabilis]XP_024026033.1 aminoacyl tRNA synthase complex-interacting multifunctional protein 1 [Morus notabilis]XP_024026034.1 aminoacyl tRNA synthase complex-interacting multifunctional protein 1 [Morus notabilis]EXB96539.1 putative methionine--tRNA ligase [Morus notabilis]